MSPRDSRRARSATSHAYWPLRLRRRTWITLGAVLLGGAGAATYAMAGPSGDAPHDGVAAREAAVHSLRLQSRGAHREGLDRHGTDRFSAVLVTWADPEQRLDGTAQVRYRAAGGEDDGNGLLAYLGSGSGGVSVSGAITMSRGTLGAPAGAHLGATLTP
ncbi:hypothetical protein [Streptomyces sp. NPDC058045]|uniref:hypothetical protein n=1 Tax=Streptomyces sp. NPDC058045 TaxID=3346311 RepID=UPI0036EB31D4